MNFWSVTAKSKDGEEVSSFIIKSPFIKNRTKEVLLSVHPEYSKLLFRKIKRPEWCRLWEGEEC
jgi:hypothetical protein